MLGRYSFTAPPRDSDLADPHPGVLVGEQAADVQEHPAALAVELVAADAVDGDPDAFFRD